MPLAKLVVPSIGSMHHRPRAPSFHSAACSAAVISSPSTAPGRKAGRASLKRCCDAMSASVNSEPSALRLRADLR